MAKILTFRRKMPVTSEGRTPLPITYPSTRFPEIPLDERIVRIKQMLERVNELMAEIHRGLGPKR